MSEVTDRDGTPRGDSGAYPAFLSSLALPGLGQILAAAPVRGFALMLVALASIAAVAAGLVRLPVFPAFGPADAAACAVMLLLWLFAPYDAWFRARERVNGLVPLLPRTPRVAAFADLLWGGAGQLYLGRRRGVLVATVTALVVLLLAARPAAVVVAGLTLWNGSWALMAYRTAVHRYHSRPEYRRRAARLKTAPLTSPRAPSPSLPLATWVAAFIAAVGGLFTYRTLIDLRLPAPGALSTGGLAAGVYSDPGHGVVLAPPGRWTLQIGRSPVLVAGDEPGGAAFTLAVAVRPLFEDGDVVPSGALARFAARQEADMARRVPGFRPLSRESREHGGRPGLLLVFAAGEPGRERLTAQHTLLHRDRLVILTLSAAAGTAAPALTEMLGRLESGLVLETPQ